MLQNSNKNHKMLELDAKNTISFTKKLKPTLRKGQQQSQTRELNTKPHSASKPNLSKFAQKSQSKDKKPLTKHAFGGGKSPYYFDINNAKSERCNIDNEQNGKQRHPNDCWSIDTSVQTKTLSKTQEQLNIRYIHKERSCRQIEKHDKKDRKFSENVTNVIRDFQNLKEQHKVEKKLMEMILNERELHRLNKIYAVEETQYMIRILNADNPQKK